MNKIPVLDKGYAALISSSLSRTELKSVRAKFFKNQIDDRLLEVPVLHLEIKCPLFVQLSFSDVGLTTTPMNNQSPEAYVPTVDEVGASDLETSKMIQNDIEQTTAALMINPKSYKMDGCDTFVAQTIYPISVYNTVLVTGTLRQLALYINRKDLPSPMNQYKQALADIILGEYDFLWEYFDGGKKKKGR